MWLLISKADPEKVHTIVGGKQYVVGRQNCDITVADASVSRSQAELTMVHHETNVMKSFVTPTLTLHDVSKFGTYVNGKCVRNMMSKKAILQDGDEIKFGGSPVSVFRATYNPLIMTTSCIEKAPKKDLVKAMCLLGGHLVREWRPNCEMLIMSKINVTIKVVCALNSQRHIVTPNYLDDLYAHHLGTKEKPDPMHYLPEVVDNEVPPGVSFHPDERRITLLSGLKVYFLSAVQFNKTNLAVSTAGGQPILLEDGTEEDAESMAQANTIVISVNRDVMASLSQGCQKFVKLVYSTLADNDLRMISDPEVGWAILTCNIDKFCNPTSEITPSMYADVASQMTQLSSSQMDIDEDLLPGKRPRVDHNSSQENLDLAPSKRQKREPSPLDLPLDPPLDPSASTKQASPSVDADKNAHISTTAESKLSISVTKHNETNTKTSKHSVQTTSDSPSHDEATSAKTSMQKPSPIREGDHNGSDENENVLNHERVSKSASSRQSGDLFSNSHQLAEKPRTDVPEPRVSNLLQNFSDKDEDDSVVSVFAKRKGPRAKARKFDSDDSDEEPFNIRKGKSATKRKGLFSFDDEDDSEESSHQAPKKRSQADENNSSREQSLHQSRNGFEKKDHSGELAEKTKDKPNSSSNFNGHSVSALPVESNSEMKEGVQFTETKSHNSGPVSGWLSVGSECRIKPEPKDVPSQNSPQSDSREVQGKTNGEEEEEKKDVKPVLDDDDQDLLLDNQGRPLKNFCEVKVVKLLARPVGSHREQTQPAATNSTLKNFKNFKKTHHAGSGLLPNIIGGRDLEVYTGDRHRDIEQLFSVELEEETQRAEEERTARQLFEWDTSASKTKKPATKRKR